jgi:hypothetical protein
LQESGSDRPANMNEIEMNESDGGRRRAEEECEGQLSETSGGNEDVDEDATMLLPLSRTLLKRRNCRRPVVTGSMRTWNLRMK